MKTTIELSDDLFRQAKDQAATHGMDFETYAAALFRQGLRGKPKGMRRPIPVTIPLGRLSLPKMTNAEIFEILDREEDLAKGRIVE